MFLHRADGLALLAICGIATLCVAVGFGFSPGIVLAALLLATEYLVAFEIAGADIGSGTAVYAALLLVMTECAFWSLGVRTRSEEVDGLWREPVTNLLLLGGLSLAVGLAGVLATSAQLEGNLLLVALGGAAAVAAALIVTVITRRID